MVFYFHPRGWREEKKGDYLIYMGRDKHENEDLISYGLPLDVWFHVDNLSSAHVYLRLPEGVTIEEIPEDTLEDCAQLVKQNSIQGEYRHYTLRAWHACITMRKDVYRRLQDKQRGCRLHAVGEFEKDKRNGGWAGERATRGCMTDFATSLRN